LITVLLIVVLLILFLINVPVAFSLGLATMLVSLLAENIPLIRLPQAMFSALNSFPLLAAPFFVLAGKLMEYGGISDELIKFANSLFGRLRGGLAVVSIAACTFFAAVSGSSIATIFAIGSVMIPAMVRSGYDRNFSSAVQAAGGTIGVIIPPSIPMVLYGVAAGVSIGKLFMAGLIPGLIVGFSLALAAYWQSRKMPGLVVTGKSNFKEILLAFKNAIWAILMPVIILGGIYGGFFTPTEAAVVAVLYGFAIGTFVYRKINLATLRKILLSTVLTNSTIGMIIATASYFGMWLTLERVPQTVARTIAESNLTPIVVMLLIILFLLALGTFMDATAGLIITTPLLYPIAQQVGMDLVQFGVLMVVTLSIGILTPPFGLGLFVAAKIGETKFERLIKPVLPLVLVLIIDVLIILLFPQISVGFAGLMQR